MTMSYIKAQMKYKFKVQVNGMTNVTLEAWSAIEAVKKALTLNLARVGLRACLKSSPDNLWSNQRKTSGEASPDPLNNWRNSRMLLKGNIRELRKMFNGDGTHVPSILELLNQRLSSLALRKTLNPILAKFD